MQRARDAGQALGDDPVAAVTAIADRVTALVAGLDGTELLTSIVGGMRLVDYLPSRTFELVVHTADLATALGEPVEPPHTAATQALGIVTEVVVGDGKAGAVLLAATGRSALPPGFSVLWPAAPAASAQAEAERVPGRVEEDPERRAGLVLGPRGTERHDLAFADIEVLDDHVEVHLLRDVLGRPGRGAVVLDGTWKDRHIP